MCRSPIFARELVLKMFTKCRWRLTNARQMTFYWHHLMLPKPETNVVDNLRNAINKSNKTSVIIIHSWPNIIIQSYSE